MEQTILITGGAGFIGSHLVKLMVEKYSNYKIVNLDALTYAGNLENLTSVENAPNYQFIKGDINDAPFLEDLFQTHKFDGVIHLAAESHVDRSIKDPLSFIKTNIVGTLNLLHAAKQTWGDDFSGKRFYHVSTDEVYGTLGETGLFTEETSYDPRSPYSASKASSDHLVRAYYHTYDFPMVISNCSNNYGPMQFPEKLLPLFINNIKQNKSLPIYGDGNYTRDWLWVEDHARAIDVIYHDGKNGETYNIGGHNEWKNIDIINLLIKIMDELLGRPEGASEALKTYVTDRPGHDRRYAIDATKLKDELGWVPSLQMEEGLRLTAEWYLANSEWMDKITSGEYQKYYDNQYADR